MSNRNQKTFLIINLSYFGDVLLTNTLAQNIKLEFPDSKIVFLTNKPFYEAALYQKYIDDVIYFDKENEGLLGFLKFVFSCPYRNKIDTAFIIYGNDRGVLISWFLGARKRVACSNSFTKYFLTHSFRSHDDIVHAEDINAVSFTVLTGKKAEKFAISYNPPEISDEFLSKIAEEFKNREIVGLCTTSKKKEKDMPLESAVRIIEKLNSQGKVVFYLGAGEAALRYSAGLKEAGADFVDLTNKTSICQLAQVLKLCKGLISVDTGTMHLACAVKTPVAAVFYLTDYIAKWAPRGFLYKSVVIRDNYDADNIVNSFNDLIR
jgi:ADP-heptose:LPS heptosyltransferase